MAPQKTYDLFISFRGADVRQNLLTHLYAAFKAKGVNVFLDTKLERGEEISSGLLKAIEESKVALIIFSQNYASSPWCLEELVKIMECRSDYGQKVFPVFYGVEAAHVENQTGSYGEAFTKHEKEIEDKKMIKLWRKILTDVSYISGWDSGTIRNDHALVEQIVNDIASKLSKQQVPEIPRYEIPNRNTSSQSQPSGSNAYNPYNATPNQSSYNVQQTRPLSQQPSSSNAYVNNYAELLRKTQEDSANHAHAQARQMEELSMLERQSTSRVVNANNSDVEMRKREMQAFNDRNRQLDMQRLSQIKNLYNIR